MKLLCVVFLAGLALCNAVSVPETQELSANEVQELDLVLRDILEEQRSRRDVREGLTKIFDRILEKVAEMTEKGKEVNGDLITKAKNVLEKLKDKGIDLRGKIRDRGVNLPEKAKELYKKFLEKLGIGEKQYAEGDRSTRDAIETLREMFDKLLKMVTDSTRKGHEISEELAEKIKNLFERAKKFGLNLREKIREKGESLSGQARELYNKFLEQIGIGGVEEEEYSELEDIVFVDDDYEMQTELGKALRDHMTGILQLIKESVERGVVVKDETIEKVRAIYEKMQEIKVELDFRAKGLLEKIRDKGTNVWQKIKNIFKKKTQERSTRDAMETLKDMFEKLLKMVTDSTRKGHEISEELAEKIKNLYERAKKFGLNLREKIREKGESLSGEARELYNKFLEQIGIGGVEEEEDSELDDIVFVDGDYEIQTEVGKALRDHLVGILELIISSVERGVVVTEETIEKLGAVYGKMKEIKVELDLRAKELLMKIKDKGKSIWQKIKNVFKRNKQEMEAAEDAKRFGKILNQLIERIRKFLVNGKEIRESFVDILKNVVQKMKEAGMGDAEINEKFLRLLRMLSERGKEILRDLMEKLDIKREERMIEYADDQAEDGDEDFIEKLGKALKRFLTNLKEVLESRRGLSKRLFEKMKGMIEKMKNFGMGDSEIGKKFRDLYEQLNKLGKKALDHLMKELGFKKEERMIEYDDDGEDDLKEDKNEEDEKEIQGRLRKILQKFLNKVVEVLQSNRKIGVRIVERMKDMIQKMKKIGLTDSDINGQFSDLFKKLTDKGKQILEKLMERLGLKKEARMIEFAEDGENPEVAKDLREQFENLVQKIKDALESGKSLRDGLEKLNEIREKLQELRVKLGDRAKELGEKLREKIREYFEKMINKFIGKEPRSLKDAYENIKEYLKNLQIDLKEKFVKFGEWAKEKFERGLEKGRSRTETLKKLAREFIYDIKFLRKDTIMQAKYFFRESKEDLGDLYEVVTEKIRQKLEKIEAFESARDYLKNLKIDLREKFAKFGEWAKDKFEKRLDTSKDRAENLKNLARQFIDEAKVIGKDVAVQAKEFFREYKEDLGTIYEGVREKIREILERQD